MDILELNNKLDQLGNTWELYRQANNERISRIEEGKNVDPLINEKLEKLNNAMDEYKSKINNIEVAISRPTNGLEETKSFEEVEYKNALNNYLRKGLETELSNLELKRDLTTAVGDTSSYGGFLLSPNLQRFIIERLADRCVMRKICSVQEISTASFDVLNSSGMTPSWLSETGTVNDTDTTIFSKKTINTFDLVAQPKVTQKLIDDAAIDLEQWLGEKLADDFADAEENAFINGTGDTANQPTGLLSYIGVESGGIEAITSQAATGSLITENDIMNLYYTLSDKYVNNASFLMPRSAMKHIRQLKDATSGQYLWNPALLAGKEDTLLGCPIYQSSHMPAAAKGSKSILFGDFKYYQIVDRVGIRILRDPFTAKPYIRFYTTKRLGGDVVDTNAFKALVCSSK